MNLPVAFENSTKQLLGEDWDAFVSVLSTESPTSIRLNPNKPSEQIGSIKIPWTKNGYYLEERPQFTFDPLFHAGAYYVQEASSMFLELAISQSTDLSKSLVVLDLCAAPGGKSTHLASLLSDDSLLVSNEVIRQRANILAENLTKWGNANIIVTNSDPKEFSNLPPIFDIVVVDAPCSGEGMFRKDNAAISEWSENNVQLCTQRQKRILNDVWGCLKKDGILIYSTCTYNQQENEKNLEWLAKEHSVECIDLEIPETWNIQKSTLSNITGYRFYPHKVNGEGFFIAALRKKEGFETHLKPKKKSNLVLASKNERQLVEGLLQANSDLGFYKNKEDIHVFLKNHYAIAELVKEHLHLVQLGTPIAALKRNGFVPLHGLAMSKHLNREAYPDVETTLDEAIHYLRKENVMPEGLRDGWNLLQYKGLPLGFINKIGNRTNNYYPKEWRIRSNWEGS